MGDSFSQKKMTLWNGWPIKTWNPEIDKIFHDLVWTQKPLVSTCFLTRRDVDSTMENGGFNKTKWFLNMFLSCENHRFHPCWTWFSYVFMGFISFHGCLHDVCLHDVSSTAQALRAFHLLSSASCPQNLPPWPPRRPSVLPPLPLAMGNIFWRSCCHPHAKLNRLDKARPLGLLGYQWKRTPCKPLAYWHWWLRVYFIYNICNYWTCNFFWDENPSWPGLWLGFGPTTSAKSNPKCKW